jgi:hypothetical protein
MNIKFMRKISSVFLISVFFLTFSCQDDEEGLTGQDTADISEEAVTDAYFQDLDDMAGVAIEAPTGSEYSGGRTSGTIRIEDQRFKCDGAVITLTRAENSTPESPIGTIVVDFGTGCTDQRGNVRTGKLTFAYNGKRFVVGSTVVITTENYTINGIKLEGVRTMTNVESNNSSSPRFNVVLVNGKATFEDNTVAERNSNITWQWVRGTTRADDQLIIDKSSVATGKTRKGRNYSLTFASDLKYKRFCGIAVEGIKNYVIDGKKEISIDYGDGTCDKIINVTFNGKTRTITID